jgi:hypothetical protein
MASANATPPGAALPSVLAGLRAGVLGALAMLGWLGVSAVWQRRGFWTAANLMASFFFGEAAVRPGFSRMTMSGVALYVLLYGSLGVLFGTAARGRVRGLRLLLCGMVFGAAWYYASFGFAWKRLAPLVALLHAERPTLLGHVLYGALLALGLGVTSGETPIDAEEARTRPPEGESLT